jgi:hypothetical protein
MRRLDLVAGARWLVVVCWVVAAATSASHADATKRAKLVIVSAVYGDLANEKTVDVKQKLAEQVKDDNLSVEVTKERFGDPAPGASKQLKVSYTVDGLYHSKTIDQGDVIDISTRLFIRKAVYGDLANGKSDDVTEQVADLVRKNSLTVKADNATFGDPAEGFVKKLRVDYLFDGVKGSKTVNEGETLTLSEKGK